MKGEVFQVFVVVICLDYMFDIFEDFKDFGWFIFEIYFFMLDVEGCCEIFLLLDFCVLLD